MHTSGLGTVKLLMEEKSKILFSFFSPPGFIISFIIFFVVIRLIFFNTVNTLSCINNVVIVSGG